MSENDSRPSVLVPVDVSTGERPDPDLLELLEPTRVVVAGWYPVPDQTAPEQLQDAHEDEAVEHVQAIASDFEGTDTAVETVVVFTRDRAMTVDRLADEYDCGVVLVPRPVQRVDRLLVPIRADVNLEAILSVVGAILADGDATVTLLHAVEDDEAAEAGTVLLRGAVDQLREAGVDEDRVETLTLDSNAPVDDIVDAATNHDVLIIGESEPSLIETVIGDVPEVLIERTDRPVLVVRKPDDDAPADDEGDDDAS
jgi:nucleotide-binding universal stress UspA family protein